MKKRKIGTLNVLTGKFTPIAKQKRKDPKKVTIRASHAKRTPRKPQRPTEVPREIALENSAYDKLYDLTRWYDDTPSFIELPDEAHELVSDKQADLIPENALPEHWYINSIQIETVEYAAIHGTKPGSLVALVSKIDDDGVESDAELVVRITNKSWDDLACRLKRR